MSKLSAGAMRHTFGDVRHNRVIPQQYPSDFDWHCVKSLKVAFAL
jgi:hypothetical protein